MKIKMLWLRGAVFGLLVTAVFHGLLLLLIHFHVELGGHILSSALVFIVAALEFPAVWIGRLLKLPLENAPTGFILPDFNLWGYVLTFVFWAAACACAGLILDIRKVPAKKIYSGLLWTALVLAILLSWTVKVFVFDS